VDKNKCNYHARGSLLETIPWLETLKERGKINSLSPKDFRNKIEILHKHLNAYMRETKEQKDISSSLLITSYQLPKYAY